MVSDGSGEIGASKLTREILSVMEAVPEVVDRMTGVNITKRMMAWSRTTRINLEILPPCPILGPVRFF